MPGAGPPPPASTSSPRPFRLRRARTNDVTGQARRRPNVGSGKARLRTAPPAQALSLARVHLPAPGRILRVHLPRLRMGDHSECTLRNAKRDRRVRPDRLGRAVWVLGAAVLPNEIKVRMRGSVAQGGSAGASGCLLVRPQILRTPPAGEGRLAGAGGCPPRQKAPLLLFPPSFHPPPPREARSSCTAESRIATTTARAMRSPPMRPRLTNHAMREDAMEVSRKIWATAIPMPPSNANQNVASPRPNTATRMRDIQDGIACCLAIGGTPAGQGLAAPWRTRPTWCRGQPTATDTRVVRVTLPRVYHGGGSGGGGWVRAGSAADPPHAARRARVDWPAAEEVPIASRHPLLLLPPTFSPPPRPPPAWRSRLRQKRTTSPVCSTWNTHPQCPWGLADAVLAGCTDPLLRQMRTTLGPRGSYPFIPVSVTPSMK